MDKHEDPLSADTPEPRAKGAPGPEGATSGWVALAARLRPDGRRLFSVAQTSVIQPDLLVTRRTRWVTLGVAAVLLLALLCGAARLLAAASADAAQPNAVGRQFCAALSGQRYTAAYALLAPSGRNGRTADQYVAEATLHDMVDGAITSCAIGSSGGWTHDLTMLVTNPTRVDVPAAIVRKRLGSRAGTIQLVRVGGAWRVSTLAGSLQGTPIEPLQLVQHFCHALTTGDYASAYGDLSARQRSLEHSETAFAATAARPAGASYGACTLSYTTYVVKSDAATLALSLTIRVATPTGTAAIPMTAHAALVREHGAWKLDGLDFSAPSA